MLGEFALLAFYRRRGRAAAGLAFLPRVHLSADALDVIAHKQLENPRIASRVTPMLGLVATMIPMGPALKSCPMAIWRQVSENLTIAFSAVILALIAASITYWVVNVRHAAGWPKNCSNRRAFTEPANATLAKLLHGGNRGPDPLRGQSHRHLPRGHRRAAHRSGAEPAINPFNKRGRDGDHRPANRPWK